MAQNPPPPCGMPGVPNTYIDTLNGITAFSNDSTGPVGCYDVASFEWECVEFVQRYFSQRFKLDLGSIPVAFQAFALLQNDSRFAAYVQGATVIPQADDIIVFGKNAATPYGHVAIAKANPIMQADGTFQIPIIEQNSYLTHVLVLQGDSVSGFKITGRLGLQSTAPIIGWVRRQVSSVVYTFTGAPFNQFVNTSCPPTCRITGSITLAQPLPPNINLPVGQLAGSSSNFTPLSFSFTDGVTTATNQTCPDTIFNANTDANGNITQYAMSVCFSQGSKYFFLFYYPPFSTQEGINNGASYQAYFLASSGVSGGTWSISSAQTPPPVIISVTGPNQPSWRTECSVAGALRELDTIEQLHERSDFGDHGDSNCTAQTNCSPGAWAGTSMPSVAAASGVTPNGSYYTPSNPGPGIAAYPPASSLNALITQSFLFNVMGSQ